MSKDEILQVLQGKAKKQARKSYPLRVDHEVFEKIEAINDKSGIDNINEVLNLLIKLGLEEYEKNKA